MDAQKFGRFLQTQRKQRGLTQSQLAEQLHVTDKAVSRWERGVGLPDINLLEPLAQALDLSLTELIRSEKIEESTLPRDTADAAVAEVLSLSETRRRHRTSWLCSFLIWAATFFFMLVILFFVDVMWVRLVSIFLLLRCQNAVCQLADALLFPEKHRAKHSWKYHLKVAILSVALILYPLIFLMQPYIGLQACGTLALVLAALLGLWGIWEICHYVPTMPDGQ